MQPERNAERKQILEMLAQGKITAQDADRLLDRLEAVSGERSRLEAGAPGEGASKPKRPRFLRVEVDSPSGDNVNIRIPLFFVRAGIKLSAVMPSEARRRIEAKGVDLSHLSELQGEDLIEALRELTIDVSDSDGDKVRIYCE